MGRRVLVTGAGGFIGSHLVEALVSRGDSVRAMVRYNGRGDRGMLELVARERLAGVDVVQGDLTDPYFVRGAVKGCDAVFHLGALIAIPYSYHAPAHVFQTNVMGTLHVAQACVEHGARMVHTSTSEVYGSAQFVPITELHPTVGQSPYSASKIGADHCVESFHRAFGLPAVIVRPFNTYGPRQSARAVLPSMIAQALTRESLHLGSLEPTRDLNFVSDTVAGFVLAAERDAALGQVVNLANGKEISVGDLATKVMRAVGRELTVVTESARLRPGASEVARLRGDATRARELLGWTPKVSLDEGIARLVEYVRENLGRYKPEQYAV